MRSDRHMVKLMRPASWFGDMWREALPAGNGFVGAAVYGAVASETILVSHAALWHWGRRSQLPDVSHTLQQARTLIDSGDLRGANALSSEALTREGYASALYSPCPLCDIKIDMECRSPFRHYSGSLDMATGEILVTWEMGGSSFTRRLFVSRSADMIVCEVCATAPLVGGRVRLQLHDNSDEATARMRAEVGDTLECKSDGEYIHYAARNDDGTDFGAVLRLVGGTGEPIGGGIAVAQGSRYLFAVKVFVRGSRGVDWACLAAELARVPDDYDALLADHVAVHRPLYESVDLALTPGTADQPAGTFAESGGHPAPRSVEQLLAQAYDDKASPELIERLWRFGRYLFISGTHEESFPFALYGLWGGSYALPWSHNMANENIQMIYWHSLAGGLAYAMKGFIRYYEGLMDDFRAAARSLFGCRGIYLSAGSTPNMGLPNQVVPVITNWVSAGGWLCQHLYDYYRYTGDTQLLRNSILPFMREVAVFYEDYSTTGADGKCTIYPSVSPENTPANFMPADFTENMGHICPSVANATMDFAVMKELLTNLIEGAEFAGVYAGDVDRWRGLLASIPAYMMNPDGDIKEWMHPDLNDHYNHRHLSHLYPVFPGREIGKASDLLGSFDLAVQKRELRGQSGWSLAHMSCVYSRLGDAERAVECLDTLAKGCVQSNLYTVHNDWRGMGASMDLGPFAPVQLDANMGVVNAVQEMLACVSHDTIELLPACPQRFGRGSLKRLRFPGGQLSFTWDLDARSVDIEVVAARECRLGLVFPPFCGGSVELSLAAGEVYRRALASHR